MTPALAAILWVLAAAATAALPMRLQPWPGLPLLLSAPALIWWIGATYGWVWLLPALFAFVSMFRHPLRYLALRAIGRRPARHAREPARDRAAP